MSLAGDLEGVDIFIFTDNAVGKAAFYKGNSISPFLFNLILRLTILENNMKMKLYLVNMVGTRMISQGSDGLSRGDMLEGVMNGEDMLYVVPLHKSALEKQPNLEA